MKHLPKYKIPAKHIKKPNQEEFLLRNNNYNYNFFIQFAANTGGKLRINRALSPVFSKTEANQV